MGSKDCIFCKIINGEVPGKIVYQDEEVVAFWDINPKAPVHILVCPVKHLESVISATEAEKELLGNLLLKAKQIAYKLDLASSGFRLVINNGQGAGQVVFHLHLHLLGGWNKDSISHKLDLE